MHLSIAFDPGASLTKVIYQVETGPPQLLLMDPDVVMVPRETLELSNQPFFETVTPENNAWVQRTRSGGSQVAVVGFLAKQLAIETIPDWSIPKTELSFAKLLAVVGSILQREQLSEHDIQVSIVALLPLNEYRDRQLLEQEVRRSLQRFYFRGHSMATKLRHFRCIPEGGGFLWQLCEEEGGEWFQQRTICVAMLGHRNSSLLTYSQGQLNRHRSGNHPGFITFINAIEPETRLDHLATTQHLYELGDNISSEQLTRSPLLRFREPKFRKKEAKTIAKLIQAARTDYWLSLRQWLNELMPPQINLMIVSGGAGHYLKSEIERDFSWAEPIWSPTHNESCLNALIQTYPDHLNLQYRLVDVWLAFSNYINFQCASRAAA